MSQRIKLPTSHTGFHRKVFYRVEQDEGLGRWRYCFSICGQERIGTIEARLGLLAARRVRGLIDKALGVSETGTE
ncbi:MULTISPECIES: hypothetical protein [unclassified Bradyrhizobium]|uniref:hypothetical protein n=1 Tax=unclassified Bradyrhizobium TaxID=2631580 RepID=UPI001FFB1D19|nr:MULTISPECIES: hypothetical protein [unclassified Bradyrhizobium]MCK1268760.1 hypothetical protein [Bradyrhizobium sp. 84]MCK1371255.1 hypothetical protein [Bradyrhizobium sp. 49]MCK1413116.1 hypothetical protein [Bradyrhizobium sp. CW4]MCK1437484.1 hypothetical protein [Bradyrhizobium sp. 15]MCK1551693.1 hypothetical protein [Bradyrhizobium sp. 177]